VKVELILLRPTSMKWTKKSVKCMCWHQCYFSSVNEYENGND